MANTSSIEAQQIEAAVNIANSVLNRTEFVVAPLASKMGISPQELLNNISLHAFAAAVESLQQTPSSTPTMGRSI